MLNDFRVDWVERNASKSEHFWALKEEIVSLYLTKRNGMVPNAF